MSRLKTLHAALALLIGIMATLSSAAPPHMSFSFSPLNTSSGVHAHPTSTIHSHTWTLNSSLTFHTSPTGTTHSQTTISKHSSSRNTPTKSTSRSTSRSTTHSVPVVTVTPTPPPVPTVTSIQFITKTTSPSIVTPTTTITTLVPGPTNTVVVSPEEYSAWQASLSAEAATKQAGSLNHFHEELARQVTVWPSKPSTTTSPQSTCTDSSGQVACTPRVISHPPSMPKFNDSSISCLSTTISGLPFNDIKAFAAQACPDFAQIDDSDSSPKISRVTSGGGQEVTFQLDYSFAGHQLGSSFGLGQDACIEGFTHALSHCDDKDGGLFQNGLVHASYEGVPVTFLTSVVESGSEKRVDRDEDGSTLPDVPEDPAMPLSDQATRSSNAAFAERGSTESSVPVVPSKLDMVNVTGLVVADKVLYECTTGSGNTGCCARGPWIPSSQAASLSADYCSWITKGKPTFDLFPLGVWWAHRTTGVIGYYVWNSVNETKALSRTQCELWIDRLKADCTTAAAGFTGGSLLVDGLYLFVEVTGADDDDGKSRRGLSGHGEDYEILDV